jgi:hypothetical protein
MSTESVEDALSKRAAKIVTHMNDDHGDSLKAYLQHFKQLDAIKGELTQISFTNSSRKSYRSNSTSNNRCHRTRQSPHVNERLDGDDWPPYVRAQTYVFGST